MAKWMLVPQWKQTPPIDVGDDQEVELFLALRMDIDELPLCVTVGNDLVELYHFQRRSNFEFGSGSNLNNTLTMDLDVSPLKACPNLLNSVVQPSEVNDGRGSGGDKNADAQKFWDSLLSIGSIVETPIIQDDLVSDSERDIKYFKGFSSSSSRSTNELQSAYVMSNQLIERSCCVYPHQLDSNQEVPPQLDFFEHTERFPAPCFEGTKKSFDASSTIYNL